MEGGGGIIRVACIRTLRRYIRMALLSGRGLRDTVGSEGSVACLVIVDQSENVAGSNLQISHMRSSFALLHLSFAALNIFMGAISKREVPDAVQLWYWTDRCSISKELYHAAQSDCMLVILWGTSCRSRA